MCLIVSSENGKLIDLTDLEIAYNNNPDGAGVMWFEDGRVHQLHTVPNSFAEVRDLAYHVAGKPHAMHLRYCTRGKINHDNCHPFTVLNKDQGDDHDLTLMHNGTFQWITFTEEHKKLDWSDTAVFAGRLQKNLREHKSTSKIQLDHIFDGQIVERLSKRVSSWNKVVFLDSNGRWSYLNKSAGEIRHEMWYSNTYSLKVGYRDKQVAHHGPSKTYTYVNGVKTETTTSYSTSFSGSTCDTIIPPKEKSKGAKTKTTFQRSGLSSNYVYMVTASHFEDDFVLVDPQTMRTVNDNKRLGKSERKKLRAWLENEKKLEELRAEKKYERKMLTDSKGRKIATVTKPSDKDSSVKTAETIVVSDKTKEDSKIVTPFDDEDTIPLYQLPGFYTESMFQ